MAWDVFIALIGFAFVSSVTPGPNNFMLLASGVNFGFWRTLPHMCGITVGFSSLLLAVGFGLGALLEAFPSLKLALKVLGGGYLLYLAYKIAMSRSLNLVDGGSVPMSLSAAALFQWVNPKAWIMATTAMIVYTNDEHRWLSIFIVVAGFALTNFPSVSIWAGFGTMLKQWFSDRGRLKWFNICMGLALAATLWPMMRE